MAIDSFEDWVNHSGIHICGKFRVHPLRAGLYFSQWILGLVTGSSLGTGQEIMTCIRTAFLSILTIPPWYMVILDSQSLLAIH